MTFFTEKLPSGAVIYTSFPDNTLAVNQPRRLAVLDFPETDDAEAIERTAMFFNAEGYEYFALPVKPAATPEEARTIAYEAHDFMVRRSATFMMEGDMFNVYARGKNAMFALALGIDGGRVSSIMLREPEHVFPDFPETLWSQRSAPVFYSKKHPDHRDLEFGKNMVKYHTLSSMHLGENVPDAQGILEWLYRIRLQHGRVIKPLP